MTRKKIGIYCTAIWGNNNKTHRCRHRRHAMPSPLDPGCTALPQPDGRTDRRTGCDAGTNMPLQFIDLGNVQRNMPMGTWSAWKRTQEDPARLEWVQTAARCRQSHLPRCRAASRLAPGSPVQAGAASARGGVGILHPLTRQTPLSSSAPTAPQQQRFLKQTRPASMCEQPCIPGPSVLSCQLQRQHTSPCRVHCPSPPATSAEIRGYPRERWPRASAGRQQPGEAGAPLPRRSGRNPPSP